MTSYNFCPYCGHKIEGNPKFCAECGKPLTSSSASEQTSSKLGKGFSSLFNKVSKTATGLTSKVKETLNEKKEASKRSAKISVLDTAASNEYTVANIPAEYGDGLLKESVTLSITNKAILIYGKRSSLNKKDGLQLMLRINLADISEIYKEKSPATYIVSYHIVTPEKEHTVIIPAEPYKFILYLSKVAKINGNLYNIDLLPDEKMLGISNGALKNNLQKIKGTLYYSNKRIVFTKLSAFDAATAEGSKIEFSINRDKIESLTENKGTLSCSYTITTHDEEYVFSFNGLVPKSFIAIVPGAEGNKEILERKKKVGKVLKVASVAAAFVGIGGLDSDAADIDTGDDYSGDMDATAVDFDGDGNADAIEIDSNGDGQVDAVIADTDGDGVMDSFMADKDGDGNVDMVGTDTDGDGTFDKIAYDTNGDGNLDTIEMDSDGDGVIDMAGADTNGDGIVDTDVSAENSDSSVSDNNDGTDSMIQDYNDAQSRVMELNREIQNTADPLQREALIRERDNIINHAPSPADIMLNR